MSMWEMILISCETRAGVGPVLRVSVVVGGVGGPHPPTASPSRLVRRVTCAPMLGSRALVLLGTLWRRQEPLARSRRRRLRARWRGVHFRSPDRSGVPGAVRGAPRIAAPCHLLRATLFVKAQRVIAVYLLHVLVATADVPQGGHGVLAGADGGDAQGIEVSFSDERPTEVPTAGASSAATCPARWPSDSWQRGPSCRREYSIL